MPDITLNAVVLRATNYKESDRMLTLLSPERGRIDAIARGCRKATSRLLPASQLFASGEFLFSERKNATTQYMSLRSAYIHDAFFPIASDYDSLQNAVYVLEWCLRVTQPGQNAEELFSLLLTSLTHYAYGDLRPGRVTAVFLARLSVVLGVKPAIDVCAHCGASSPIPRLWDAAMGGVVCKQCAPYAPPVESEALDAFTQALTCDASFVLDATDQAVRAMRTLMMRFLDCTLA